MYQKMLQSRDNWLLISHLFSVAGEKDWDFWAWRHLIKFDATANVVTQFTAFNALNAFWVSEYAMKKEQFYLFLYTHSK